VLKLLRRAVAQRGMESQPVIVLLKEALDVAAQVPEIPIPIGVNLLTFERLDNTLTTRVVVGVGRPAHARDPLMLLEHCHVGRGGVLDPPIRVMHQARCRLTGCNRLLQRLDRQSAGQRLLQLLRTLLEHPLRCEAVREGNRKGYRITGTGSYLPLLPEQLAPLDSPQEMCAVERGVPKGDISLLTPHLERTIIAFSGEIKVAA